MYKAILKVPPFEDVILYEKRKERKLFDGTVQVLSYTLDFHLVHLPIVKNLWFSIFSFFPVRSSWDKNNASFFL